MVEKSIEFINRAGVLLAFPIRNEREPASLWQKLYPRTKMNWAWGEEGQSKVADHWHLMKVLSADRRVVYSKWYQGRATFFCRDLFSALMALRRRREQEPIRSEYAQDILAALEADSPMSTRDLKITCGLQGKLNEAIFRSALKELFLNFLVVGFGEVDDGAFPSLAIGASQIVFEDLFTDSINLPAAQAQALVDGLMPEGSKVRKYLDRTFS